MTRLHIYALMANLEMQRCTEYAYDAYNIYKYSYKY